MSNKQAYWLVFGFLGAPVVCFAIAFFIGLMPDYIAAVFAGLWTVTALAIISLLSVRADLYAALEADRSRTARR